MNDKVTISISKYLFFTHLTCAKDFDLNFQIFCLSDRLMLETSNSQPPNFNIFYLLQTYLGTTSNPVQSLDSQYFLRK